MKNRLILLMVSVLAASALSSPYFLIDNYQEWDSARYGLFPENHVRPMSPADWTQHMDPWLGPEVEGIPYLELQPVQFVPCEGETGLLYPYEGPEYGDEDAGLVMGWGTNDGQEGNYASGWKLVYGIDPDLSNAMVQITVNPPPPPAGAPAGAGITAISFAFVDVNGLRRVWWWSVPAAIPYGVPTPVNIDGSMTGIGAANPPATGYANAPGFDITQVVSFDVDENFNYIFGTVPVPPPGQPQFVGAWNYWHNLLVTNKDTRVNKGIWVKYSQPPEVINEERPPEIYGWDVRSVFPWNFDNGVMFTMAADDWICKDPRPVTDIHWWGSFIGWTQPTLPPQVPDYFMMMIWKDVPAGADGAPSRPAELLWTHRCYKWVWNFAGYDVDPRLEFIDKPNYNWDLLGPPQDNESCFQFNQLLSEDDWFYQEPNDQTGVGNVYWLGIAAVYEQSEEIRYPWGWKTKPYDRSKAPDAAVVIQSLDQMTPPFDSLFNPGPGGHVTTVKQFYPIVLPDPMAYPQGRWFDLAFELTTNQKPPGTCYDLQGDINHDCVVDLNDLAILSSDWLMTTTP